MLQRLLLGAIGGLVMLVATLVVVALLMRTDAVESLMPSVELEPSPEAVADEEPDEPAVAPPRDCPGDAERLVLRMPLARACRSDRDCVLGLGRERCITAFNIGLAGSIEEALTDYRANCGAPSAEMDTALDCKAPTGRRTPRCIASVCSALDGDSDGLESATREHLNQRGQTRSR